MADSTDFWNNIDAGDVWGGIVDVAKTSLPAALDRTGARGVTPSAADKVAPVDTTGKPVSGAPTKSVFTSKPVLIGAAVAAILLVVVLVRK